jgi:hypothetical protein
MHHHVMIELLKGEATWYHFPRAIGSFNENLINIMNLKLQNAEWKSQAFSLHETKKFKRGEKKTHAMLKQKLKNQTKLRLQEGSSKVWK